jgi:hypothetical protein
MRITVMAKKPNPIVAPLDATVSPERAALALDLARLIRLRVRYQRQQAQEAGKGDNPPAASAGRDLSGLPSRRKTL